MTNLTNQTAFITGASRGIGEVCAVAFARAGCDVALLARSEGLLEETADRCQSEGADTEIYVQDITDFDELERSIDDCHDTLGGPDILVNNAGYSIRHPIDEADVDAWDDVIDVNLKAVYHASHYALQHMDGDGREAIINIASIAGKMSFPSGGAYCSSKHGVVGLTGSIYEDVREQGVKVTAINPGYVNTGFVGSSDLDRDKMIQPEDIAETALFVARYPETGCPTEIKVRPQRTPYIE